MPSISFPFSAWVGLLVAGNEIAGNGYARLPVTFELTADGYTAANNATLQWSQATGTWGLITGVDVYDAAVGGHVLGAFVPVSPPTVGLYERVRIPPAGFECVAAKVITGFGTLTFGVGRYGTTQRLAPAGSSIGSPYGVGGYGYGAYERIDQGVLLLKSFAPLVLATPQPGDWPDADDCEAAAWTPVALCGGQPGDWTPHGPFEVS